LLLTAENVRNFVKGDANWITSGNCRGLDEIIHGGDLTVLLARVPRTIGGLDQAL